LAELPLRLPKLALEALQLALDTSHLTLDSFDPVDRIVLRIGHERQDRRTDCGQRAAGATAPVGLGTHAPAFPLFDETRLLDKLINPRAHQRD
jgi:hypothetical protein